MLASIGQEGEAGHCLYSETVLSPKCMWPMAATAASIAPEDSCHPDGPSDPAWIPLADHDSEQPVIKAISQVSSAPLRDA